MAIWAGRPKDEIKERVKVIRTHTAKLMWRWGGGVRVQQKKFDDQAGVCPLCDLPMEKEDLDLDHAISIYVYAQSRMPIEDAARTANLWGNIIAVHPVCNMAKGSLDIEEFKERAEAGEASLSRFLPDVLPVGVSPTTIWLHQNTERASEKHNKYHVPYGTSLSCALCQGAVVLIDQNGLKRLRYPKGRGPWLLHYRPTQKVGYHNRWHVRRGITNPSCKFCQGEVEKLVSQSSA